MINYPNSSRIDLKEEYHGVEIQDPYRWLEDIDSKQTAQWIEEQNRVTFDYLEGIPEREEIHKRLTSLWNYEKFGVPEQHGGRYFFTRNDGLQNQSVLYWMDSLSAQPKVLLDPNRLSEDGTLALTGYAVNHDGQLLAYGISASGSDWQEWRVREVGTGQDLDDHLRWVKFSSASWTKDDQGIYYSRYDEPSDGHVYKDENYYQKLFFHRLNTLQETDRLVYERPDHKEWGFDGQVSEDGRYLIITVWKGTHRENGVFYKDLYAENGEIIELLNEFDASYTFIANQGPEFYFQTDLDAPLSRLVTINIHQPERSEWVQVIPEAPDALESISLVGMRFIAVYLHHARSRVLLYEQNGSLLGEIKLPGLGSVIGFTGEQEDTETFYHFSSFTTPGTVYRYDLLSEASFVFKEPLVDFDQAAFDIKQVFYSSKDGTRVPMFICHKKGLQFDGDTQTYLYGYGGFNIAQVPTFSVGALWWMERGGIYAQANLRGGGEYGKTWHDGGAKHKKQNVFDDFIAAAEWLISQNYTRPKRLAIGGRSNGGLLVGACLTQRPDLYGACMATVGVLDMLRFHKFTIGWAWTSDYGSPEEPQDFKALLAYSPYHNIRAGTVYPATLILTGDHDDRVFPAHSFKFAAALQAAQAGKEPLLIRIDTKAGHGLGKPISKLIDETADYWAFVVNSLS